MYHQRLTMHSIEQFGGDPKKMILFGQSAGGMSVDFYAYAYTKDPIIHGIIPQSGTAGATARSIATNGTATAVTRWSDLSQKLGCGPVADSNVSKTLACMRTKSIAAVMNATVPASSASAVGAWGPKVDDHIVFADTIARGTRGDFLKVVRLRHSQYIPQLQNN
jgi:cholinesterase